MKKALLILSIPFVLYSCKKDAVNTNAKSTHSAAKSSDCDPSDSDNPYDAKGADHNETIAWIKASGLSGQDEILSTTLIQWPNAQLPSNYLDLVNMITSTNGATDATTIANATTLTALGKQYSIQLDHIVSDLSVYDENSTFCDFKLRVSDFEKTIAGDAQLEAKDKEILLGTCAVARYSCYYHTVVNPPAPPAPNPSGMVIWITERTMTIIRADLDAYEVLCDAHLAGCASYIVGANLP